MVKQSVKSPKQYSAVLRRFRQSPKKARLVADLVRGRNVRQALDILKFTHNRAARPLEKLLKSAMANAEQESLKANEALDANELMISEVAVDQSFTASRFRPASRGSAHPYRRYWCHFRVSLVHPEDIERLKLYRQIRSQKKRVDRVADLKGLEVTGGSDE